MPLPLLPSCLQESINLPVLSAHFPAGGPRACHASCLLPLDDARLVPEKELLLQIHCCSVTHTPRSAIYSTSILSKPFQYRSITSKTSKLLVCPQHGRHGIFNFICRLVDLSRIHRVCEDINTLFHPLYPIRLPYSRDATGVLNIFWMMLGFLAALASW